MTWLYELAEDCACKFFQRTLQFWNKYTVFIKLKIRLPLLKPGHNNLDCTQDYWGDIRSNSLEIGCVQNDFNYCIRSTDISKHRLWKTFLQQIWLKAFPVKLSIVQVTKVWPKCVLSHVVNIFSDFTIWVSLSQFYSSLISQNLPRLCQSKSV